MHPRCRSIFFMKLLSAPPPKSWTCPPCFPHFPCLATRHRDFDIHLGTHAKNSNAVSPNSRSIDRSLDRRTSSDFVVRQSRFDIGTVYGPRSSRRERQRGRDERGNYDSVYFESNKYLQSLCGARYGWRDIEGSGEQSCERAPPVTRDCVLYNSRVAVV